MKMRDIRRHITLIATIVGIASNASAAPGNGSGGGKPGSPTSTTSSNRAGNTPATERGRAMDKSFKTELKERPGTRANTRIYSIEKGPGIKGLEKGHALSIPDGMSKSGRPIELKPSTESGRRAMEPQIRRYEYLTNKRGIRAYYDQAGKVKFERTPYKEYRARPEVKSLRRLP